jgi:hypothetical protein
VACPDDVEHDVDPESASELEAGHEVLAGVVDDVIGAEGSARRRPSLSMR